MCARQLQCLPVEALNQEKVTRLKWANHRVRISKVENKLLIPGHLKNDHFYCTPAAMRRQVISPTITLC